MSSITDQSDVFNTRLILRDRSQGHRELKWMFETERYINVKLVMGNYMPLIYPRAQNRRIESNPGCLGARPTNQLLQQKRQHHVPLERERDKTERLEIEEGWALPSYHHKQN